ncbi:hypothetical protein ABZ905_34395 [Streptomyces parvus]|uniref:hypothetical protein n=1 Tax=Streptomyces parvus TaxID=66428 RepID=UPI0033D602A6
MSIDDMLQNAAQAVSELWTDAEDAAERLRLVQERIAQDPEHRTNDLQDEDRLRSAEQAVQDLSHRAGREEPAERPGQRQNREGRNRPPRPMPSRREHTQYRQYGAGTIGHAVHSGSGDIVAGGKYVGTSMPETSGIEVLFEEIRKMRQYLDEDTRAAVDAALEEMASDPSEARFRRLLMTLAGIAALLGADGLPVIEAIRVLMG